MYRKKHGIPFGSPEHRSTNFILMAVDLQEDIMINDYIKEVADKENGNYVDNGDKMSQKEIDEEFDNLDIEQYNNG